MRKLRKKMDVGLDLLRPGTVPIAADTVLWFEFLLNKNLLEQHLKKDNPDPSPTDLIVKFLAIAPDQKDGDKPEVKVEGESSDTKQEIKQSKKNLALKIMSLKVAAFLKWDLGIVEEKLPLPMQVTLLQDLLYLSMEKEVDIKSHTEIDLATIPDHELFAITLYHRWVLRAFRHSQVPAKQPRVAFIPIPGLQDPAYVPPNVIEDIVRGLELQVPDAITVLNRVLESKLVPSVPVFGTFVMLTEDSTEVKQKWDEHLKISLSEFQCQIHFDLGTYFFFREEYPKAKEQFRNSFESFEKTKQPFQYCTLNKEVIEGSCAACGIEFGKKSSIKQNLLEQFHQSSRNQFLGIVSILQQDNLRKEIPLVYRDILELDIQGALSSGKFTVARDLPLQVQTLNTVRRVVSGAVAVADYVHKLEQKQTKGIEHLINALKPVLKKANKVEKNRIKVFLQYLVECDLKELIAVLPKSELKDLFTGDELQEIALKSGGEVPSLEIEWRRPVFANSNPRLEFGTLEQQLILSYQPQEIREYLMQLLTLNPKKPLHRANMKWELPIPVQSVVMNLPRGFLQDYCHILLAKSRELLHMKNFEEAQHLLNAVEQELKKHSTQLGNISFKLARLVNWESLLVSIIELLDEWPKKNSTDIVSRCKGCLSSIQSGDPIIPRVEVMEHCVVCLLNFGEWEYLTGLDKRWNLEFSAAVAYACLDIAKFKGTKKLSRDAWDLIIPIFGSPSQQKRSASGATTVVHRDSPVGNIPSRAAFMQFLERLREGSALAVVISLLTRLHNILVDEPNLELNVDYVMLWPAVLSNANSYHTRLVGETLSMLVMQALKYYPNNVSWLKLLGDLNFVTGHYSASLNYYLQAAIVTTDFFSQQIPRSVIDDQVYRRMIKCCSNLQCHTQAAVLCQFLEEVDYASAFKSLQEKNCADAMDAYYNCIWDVTILEFLVQMHTKRGELHRKQQAIKVIGLLELNSNNNEEIQREASNVRKSRFMRALARQYVC